VSQIDTGDAEDEVSWTAEYVKTGQALEPIVQKAFLKTFLHLISMGMIVKEMKTLSTGTDR